MRIVLVLVVFAVERRGAVFGERCVAWLMARIGNGTVQAHAGGDDAEAKAALQRKKKRLFSNGIVLKERWEVIKLMAEGSFGQIYRALDRMDGGRAVAIKAEADDCQLPLLSMEICVLKTIRNYSEHYGRLTHFPCFLGHGEQLGANFVVMELCGRNLMDLKKGTRDERFSAGTSLRLASQMMVALKSLHEMGWLHRDVKPSNFCMGREAANRRLVFLIDFGLCRQFMDSQREHRAPRPRCGFRGTTRYASVNMHAFKDMGRLDDLWSLFYILLEQVCVHRSQKNCCN